MSFKSISNEVNLTCQTVSKLFETLEDSNMILGYCTVINGREFGYHTYALLVKTKSSFSGKFDIYEKFHKNRLNNKDIMDDLFIMYSGYFHGEYDWIVLFYARDLISARKGINKLIDGFQDHIEDMKIEEELVPVTIAGFGNPNLKEDLQDVIKLLVNICFIKITNRKVFNLLFIFLFLRCDYKSIFFVEIISLIWGGKGNEKKNI